VDSVGQAERGAEHGGEIPEGIRADAHETWPSHDLIESWLGDSMYDFQLRPGEDVVLDEDDPEAMASARQFRDVLGRFASGVTVVTAMSGGAPVGLTCQSFASVSLNPPLVLFVPAKTSRAWPAIQRSGKFCVNFLSADQAELSNQMASKGADKFAGVAWQPAPATGSPMIEGTLGYVDCQIQSAHEAGDHFVVVGRVLHLGIHEAEQPLLFFEGKYASTDL
jgi:3-hydroxy-9,10-secoandrosta-1,3,5(10)-triene-9,17-dione monooxygenase reductase component